ncbi:TPA: ABC transporter substrate-binding protein [Pseudomonas aeruginosa]|nr:ABC transporter substrate-binding protein [Pseudomonas aeruginosa]
MSQTLNPFIRGYQHLHFVRTLCITHADDSPPVWRPLHPSQAHLPDEQIAQFPCILCNDFALITEGQEILKELESQCQTDGVVRTVVYAITGDDFYQPVHIADTYSEKSAEEVIHRLSLETGFYSRCWEISTAHITEEASRYLAELADIATPTAFQFIAFRIPYSPAIGVKLIATPWTDENLLQIEGITAAQLRQQHLDKGMPESLVDTLHLAALADIRILIFDADAPILDGLPQYEE